MIGTSSNASAHLKSLALLLSQQPGSPSLPATHADLAALVTMAKSHGVAPFLYYVLREQSALSTLPSELKQVLFEGYLQTVAFNQLALAQAHTWANHFARQEIAAIWIKGIPLAISVYPSPDLRPMGDIDVLIPRHQLPQSLALVEEISGYRAAHFDIDTSMHAMFMLGPRREIEMELHWHLVDVPGSRVLPDVDWFISQRQALSTGESTLFTFAPEAHLLYLCAHAEIEHGEADFRLLRYLDLHLLLLSYPDFDWELTIEHAVRLQWTFAVERALRIAFELFDTPVPASVFQQLQQQRSPHEDITLVSQRMIETNRWQIMLGRLAAMPWSARIRRAVSMAFPAPAYMRWRYDIKRSWQIPGYYVYRWFDFIREAGVAIDEARRSRRSNAK